MTEEIDMIAGLILEVAILQQDMEELKKLLKQIEDEIAGLPSFEMKPLRE
jgi:hypothetical protein